MDEEDRGEGMQERRGDTFKVIGKG